MQEPERTWELYTDLWNYEDRKNCVYISRLYIFFGIMTKFDSIAPSVIMLVLKTNQWLLWKSTAKQMHNS